MKFTDQTGRTAELKGVPQRIVSTVPSQTELLYDLGLGEKVVGITAFCERPKNWLEEKEIIGGTKDLRIEKIKSLKPDLIIGNKEENIREQIEALSSEFPVWLSDVKALDDALDMILDVGKICSAGDEAGTIHSQITKLRQKQASKPGSLGSVAYFIWKDPFMLAGTDTFINSMLQECGFKNVLGATEQRYPQLTLEEIARLSPDHILLSSEPYPFAVSDLHELADHFPNAAHRIVDGQMFSWYGSRITRSLEYFYRGF